MNKFKPNFLLDEQMYFDAQTTLLFQIRDELKELNSNLKKVGERGTSDENTASRKPKSNSSNSK